MLFKNGWALYLWKKYLECLYYRYIDVFLHILVNLGHLLFSVVEYITFYYVLIYFLIKYETNFHRSVRTLQNSLLRPPLNTLLVCLLIFPFGYLLSSMGFSMSARISQISNLKWDFDVQSPRPLLDIKYSMWRSVRVDS